jgi:hypothetical protein
VFGRRLYRLWPQLIVRRKWLRFSVGGAQIFRASILSPSAPGQRSRGLQRLIVRQGKTTNEDPEWDVEFYRGLLAGPNGEVAMGTRFEDWVAGRAAAETAGEVELRQRFEAAIELGLQFRDARGGSWHVTTRAFGGFRRPAG